MADNKRLAAHAAPRSTTGTTSTSAASASCSTCSTRARFTGQGASKARDLLGEVYEYFLEKFARAEGKRGGEFYTPAGVVRVLVEVLEPHQRPRLRPVLRLGRHVRPGREVPRRRTTGGPKDISVYGQELNERTWRMAKMNLAIHGLERQPRPPAGATRSPATSTPS